VKSLLLFLLFCLDICKKKSEISLWIILIWLMVNSILQVVFPLVTWAQLCITLCMVQWSRSHNYRLCLVALVHKRGIFNNAAGWILKLYIKVHSDKNSFAIPDIVRYQQMSGLLIHTVTTITISIDRIRSYTHLYILS